jgi:hypothetical protein
VTTIVTPDLNAALVAARASVSGLVHKGGWNAHSKYKYVGHEQVVMTCRKALLDHGLLIEQRSYEYVGQLPIKDAAGTPLLNWRGVHALVHTSGQERLYTYEATTLSNDKAAYQVSTALERTAFLRIMNLTGTLEEVDSGPQDVEDDSAYVPPEANTGHGYMDTKAARAAGPTIAGVIEQLNTGVANADQLVDWVANLQAWNTKQDKTPAWQAFGEFCAKNKVKEAKVVADAAARTKGAAK